MPISQLPDIAQKIACTQNVPMDVTFHLRYVPASYQLSNKRLATEHQSVIVYTPCTTVVFSVSSSHRYYLSNKMYFKMLPISNLIVVSKVKLIG